MKATDFNLQEQIKYDFNSGITSFKDSRIVIFDANAIGLLRQEIIEKFGLERAKEIFLKFGFQNGYADFMQMKLNYKFDSEMDLLISGPVIHTWEGIVSARPKETSFNRETGEFYLTGIWSNSYEAEQHLSYNDVGTEPVCWTLMGYASGWSTCFFGSILVAIEPVCMGKGDDHCEWKILPPEKWGTEADQYVKIYKELLGDKKYGSKTY
jgi:hypothetical protein